MEGVAPHPGPLGDEGDAFFLHAVTKANKFFLDESGKAERERVAKRRKNALGGTTREILRPASYDSIQTFLVNNH